MVRRFAAIPGILARTWPALLAWYLGGTAVRSGVMALATPLGAENALAALLLVPIAVLARLVSYIGMFFVLRRELVAFRDAAEGNVRATSLRDGVRDFIEVLLVAIIPFFTLYALVGLLQTDFNDYARSAFRFSGVFGGDVTEVGDGPLVIAVIAVALAGRLALRHYGARLPRWVAVIEIYLEATWVFVALRGIATVFDDVFTWASSIRVVDWVLDARRALIDLWAPVEAVLTGVDGLVPVLLQLLVLPLVWLLVAGLIYTRSLAGAMEEVLSQRMIARLRAGAARLPSVLARRTHLITDEWDDVGRPLAASARLILRAGFARLAVFAAAYSLLYAASQWADRAGYLLVGPHEYDYWIHVYPTVLAVVTAVVEPVRIVLLAVAFDVCLSLRRTPEVISAAEPASSVREEDAEAVLSPPSASAAPGPSATPSRPR